MDHVPRGVVRPEALLHPPGVLLRLQLVLLELPLDLRVVGGRDHPVEHPEDALLHRVGLVDVLHELGLEFICHRSPPHHELPEGEAAKGRAAAVAIGAVGLDDVDEAGEGAAVVELVATHVERHPGKRAEDRRPVRAVDALAAADEGRQRAARPLDLPDPVQTGHDL